MIASCKLPPVSATTYSKGDIPYLGNITHETNLNVIIFLIEPIHRNIGSDLNALSTQEMNIATEWNIKK